MCAAHGGTLFLDEIAELSRFGQAKLLQLLQSRLYYPLGDARPRYIDVRVIAATNANLAELARRRLFRDDLYYRLKGFAICVPPLAERTEDIPELAEFLCARACVRHSLPPLRLSGWALHEAQNALWPGNIRELANALEVAALLAAGEGASQIAVDHLFPAFERAPESSASPSWNEATAAFQRHYLGRALAENDWNVTATALRLGLDRQSIDHLIARLGIARP